MLKATVIQIPGKIYHLAGTNKKIIIILDGENEEGILKYLRSFNRFYFCKNNTQDIIDTIKYIMGDNTLFRPSPELRWNIIAQRFIDE